MDLFQKCQAFYSNPEFAQSLGYPANPRMAQALGIYPFFIPIERAEGTEIIVDGRRMIMVGSNNYLGLTADPRVREAAVKAIEKFGTGCTGSRFLNGTLELHQELEDRLAKFVGKQKALVFSTGYQTNLGTISALLGNEDVVISDTEVHASLIDGICLSTFRKKIKIRFFKHNDPGDLEKVLQSNSANKGKLVIVDGVFSMRGDVSPLPEIVPLCKKHGAKLLVDDAHALGILGGGRGTAFHYDCVEDVDLIMGTFSKSFASMGGFIAGDKEVIHWIQHFARPFIFSASLAPANLATVLACLEVVENEPECVARVNQIAATMRRELQNLDLNIGNSQTPIVPIILGDQVKTLKMWNSLYREGIYTNVVLPPAVAPKSSMLRTSYMATHTDDQLQKVLEVLRKVIKKI